MTWIQNGNLNVYFGKKPAPSDDIEKNKNEDRKLYLGDISNKELVLQVRMWLSYRSQTLLKTVRGVEYRRKAIAMSEIKKGILTTELKSIPGTY